MLPANHNSLDHDNSALDRLKHENDRLMELLISQDLVHTGVNSLATINDYKSMQQNARELRPLDSNLASACKFVTHIQELLVYVSATCPSTKHVSDKLVDVTPMNMTRKVRFAEPCATSNDNTHKQDLEVAFRKHTCSIQNLNGANLLSGSRDTNLYNISLDDMLKSSLICLLSKASKTKSWLWHRLLSHLNFGTLNQLAKQGLVWGLPKLKFEKDHLCSACSLGTSKKSSYKPKAVYTNQEKLSLLHMDLYGPMRVESINGKKYILIQVRMNATVQNVRADNGTKFVNQTLRDYYENVDITHETSVAHTSQQNGVVERRNQTLVEATRTILIFSKALLFL
ncbi:retrovirus-related pol polyprotein from transposon TNT 1-94 [Tanacetum coccineum]